MFEPDIGGHDLIAFIDIRQLREFQSQGNVDSLVDRLNGQDMLVVIFHQLMEKTFRFDIAIDFYDNE